MAGEVLDSRLRLLALGNVANGGDRRRLAAMQDRARQHFGDAARAIGKHDFEFVDPVWLRREAFTNQGLRRK